MALKEIIKKINGKSYIYLDESYWDKEKKSSRHRSKLIGKLDENGEKVYRAEYLIEKGELVPVEPVFETKIIGEKLIIEKVIERTGIKEQLLKIFGKEDVEKYLALASYQLATRKPMAYAKDWICCREYGLDITSQEISELMDRTTDDLVNAFFKEWINYNASKKNVLFNIASVSSYDKNNEYVQREDSEDEVNIALLSTYKNTIPLWYKILPESISDSFVLDEVNEALNVYGSIDYSIIGDKDFYFDDNLKYLNQNKVKFMMIAPENIDWVNEEIAKVVPMIKVEGDVIQEDKDDNIIYGITRAIKHKDYGALWVHIYYDATKKECELRNFNMRLKALQQKYTKENGVKATKDIAFCEKYFELFEEGGKRIVKLNLEEIQKFQDCYSSTKAIITNVKTTAKEGLKYCKLRNEIELHFDDLKNTMDCKRLRIHNEATMKGKVFICFLSLIMVNEIKNEVVKMNLEKIENLAWQELLSSCSTYGITHSRENNKDIYSVPTALQKNIFDEFKIKLC